MARDIFRFLHFDLIQGASGQRINTDSCVFADVIESELQPISILDVGSGTGVLALMMAQKFSAAKIIGIEIEPELAEIGGENFQNSPWADRLTMLCADMRHLSGSAKEFNEPMQKKYDLILCNPPFFISSQRSESEQRAIARHDVSMIPEDLAKFAADLLTADGALWVLCAFVESWRFKQALAGAFTQERSIQLAHAPGVDPHVEALKFRRTGTASLNSMSTDGGSRRIDYRNETGESSNWLIGHRKRWFPY